MAGRRRRLCRRAAATALRTDSVLLLVLRSCLPVTCGQPGTFPLPSNHPPTPPPAAQEFNLYDEGRCHTINMRQPFPLGPFECTPIRVTHSIPDCCGLVLRSEHGTIVHTGGFGAVVWWRGASTAPRRLLQAELQLEPIPAFCLLQSHMHLTCPALLLAPLLPCRRRLQD